jgi:hypothetical protein
MKLTRTHLIWIAIGLGSFLAAYSIFRSWSGIRIEERFERIMIDGVIFAALGILLYNRKLAADEDKERDRRKDTDKGKA